MYWVIPSMHVTNEYIKSSTRHVKAKLKFESRLMYITLFYYSRPYQVKMLDAWYLTHLFLLLSSSSSCRSPLIVLSSASIWIQYTRCNNDSGARAHKNLETWFFSIAILMNTPWESINSSCLGMSGISNWESCHGLMVPFVQEANTMYWVPSRSKICWEGRPEWLLIWAYPRLTPS